MAEAIHPALGTPSGLSFLWKYMITQGRGSIHQLLTAHGFVRELEVFSNFDDWYYHPARV